MGKRPFFSRRRPQVEELEPRILYSADLMAALLQADALGQGAEVRSLDSYATVAPVASASTPAELRRLEIVFVDDRVPDYQSLIDGIIGGNDGSRDIEIFVIDSRTDGISRISDVLAGRSGIDAVHLVSHGADGRVELGSSTLDLESLGQRAGQIGGWAGAFSADGDLLIYGCDVAASADGQALLESLARLTAADVAASTNATGAALLGGDWNLEYRYGAIEAALAVSENAAASWSGLLGAVPSGTETRVNTTAAGNQKEASVAMNASGAYVVVFTDQSGLDGQSDGVFAQRYNAAGVAQGSQFRVNTVFANDQRLAAVAMDASGNFVVSWQSNNQDGSGWGIYAQRYDAAGVALGLEFRVNATTAGDQVESAVSMDSSGNFTVVWKSDHAFGSKNIYGRMYNAAGTALTGEFLVNTDVTKDQSLPTIGMNGGGAFVVAWKSANTVDGSGTGVIAQLFNAAGVKQGGEFIANTTSSGNQDKPSAAMATDGSFVIAWVSGNNQDGNGDGIFAQRFSAAGAKLGGEFRVNTATLDDQDFPDVAMDGADNFTIAWQSNNQDGNSKGIYAQSYGANGTPVAYEFRVNTTTSGAQQLPSIAMRSDGGFVVVWEGNGAVVGQVDNSGIFAQRFLNQNTAPVNVVPGAQAMSAVSPLVFSAANGNAISIRDDSGPSDIRVTLTGANGTVTLGGTTGLGFSVGTGSNDATMTFTGTMANVNTALQGLSFTAAPFFSGAASLQIITNDLGATGAGGALSDTDTIAITVAQAATPYILSGSYLGNGVDNRDITGLGFQPDVVLIKARDDNGTAALRSSAMVGDVTKEMTGGGALKADQIQALLADGFQVGTDNNVNKLNKTYDWIAFKASAGWMTVGSYTGNGVGGNAVTGLGYSPEAVFVMEGLGNEAVMRTAGATNSFNFSNNTGNANYITELGSDGFSLGTDNRVNGSGRTYYYIAWNELAGSMDVGAYTGNGVDNRDIGSVGFQPEWMMIRADSNSAAVQHFDSQGPSTDSSSFFTGSSFATNRIQALQANGFQVGSSDEVNGNGVAYSYLAFRQQTAPTISAIAPQAIDEDTASGAIAFTIGDDETPPGDLHVRATSSNQSLVPNANVVLGGSGANRTVTLTPLPDQYGVTTITLEVTDGAFIQQRVFTLTVDAVNDAPTLVAPAAILVTEDVPGAITGITFSDVDHVGGQETATFTVAQGSLGATTGFGVTVGGTATTRTLTGTLADLNAYIAAGRLTYTTAQDATASVTMGVSINDQGNFGSGGAKSSGVTNVTINVTPVNDAPVVTTSGGTLPYLENAAATAIDTGLLVSDVDSTNLTGATVTISANYANGQDVLAFSNQLGITGNWNAATGVLTLSGIATVANYQSALSAITYFNNSDIPSTLVRTVSFAVNDGALPSAVATRTITVTAVNDPPTASAPPNYGATEQTTLVLQGTGLSISDLDAASGSMTLTMSVLSGVLNATAGTTGAGVAGSGTTSLVLTGTLAQINNLLAGAGGATLGYFNASDTPPPTDTLTLSVNDNGNTGGPAESGSAASTINFTAVNDPPVNTVPGTQVAREGIALVFSSGNANQISVSDPDAAGSAVRVTLSATLGTITLSTTSNLTFSAGDGSADATMTFTGTLANINAALNGMSFLPTVNVPGAASLTITTNDLGNTGSGGAKTDTDVVAITVAGFVVSPTGGLTTGEDLDTDTFSVVLRSAPTADVTIPISSSNTSEGTVSTASLVFTSANWNIAQVVTVTGVDDFLVDGDVAYTLVTGAAVSADSNYNGLDPVDVAALNVDNDTPGVRVSPTSGLTTTEAGGTATFEVELNTQPQPGTTVTISIASSNTLEGTVSVSSLTFDDTNWNIAQTVTITGVDDFVADGDIGYTIVTGNATGTDTNYNGLAVADVSVTNLDNDVVGVTVTPTSGLTTTEAGGQATFTVQLTSQPDADVTFSIVSSATAEGTVDKSSLTFTAANWNVAQIVTITGVQDFVNDGDTPYAILTGAGTSGDLAYNGLLVDDVAVINLQVANTAPVNTVPPGQSMAEDTALVFSGVNGNPISVADADAGNNALQVTLSVDQGSLTLAGTAGLVFGAGANGSASMLFTGTLAAINAALDGLRFDPFANFNGTATLQIITSDLGNTGSGGALVDTDTVAITVSPVNDAPVGTSKTVTLLEDASHTFSAADFGFTDPQDAVGGSGPNALLEVKITTLPLLGELRLDGNLVNPGDFVTLTDIDANKLVFTPADNAFGLPYTSFDFQVRDNGGLPGLDLDPTPRTITLNVTAVNDAPDITGAATGASLAETDTTISGGGTLNVVDVDPVDTVTLSVDSVAIDGASTFAGANPLSNADLKAMLAVTAGALAADPAGGTDFTWTFTSGAGGDSAFDFLREGETLVLNYTIMATDNSGAVNDNDTQLVTITITGSNDAPDITGAQTSASLAETGSTITANGTLNVVDADMADTVALAVDSVAIDVGSTFAGISPLSNADLKAMLAVTGGALAADPSGGTDFSWTFTSGASGDSAFDFLREGETLVLNYTLKATDNSGALNDNDTQQVTITITGSNDAPDITGAQVSASLVETNATITANGTLNVVDADLNDTVTLGVDSVAVDGTSTFAGTNPLTNADLKAMLVVTGDALLADPTAGTDFSWTFTSGASGDGAFDFLREGETLVLNYTIKATDDSGAVNDNDAQLVTITITGSNDAPDITGAQISAGLGQTNTTITANGTLNVVDADLADTVTLTVDTVAVDAASTFAGTNPLSNADLKAMMVVTAGALAADPAGGTDFTWTFTSGASGDGAFDFLREGETLVLNYTIKATDDSGAVNDNDTQVVTITITGSNDAPDITGAQVSASLSETNTTVTASGTLNVVDANLADTVLLSVDTVAVDAASTFAGANPLSNADLKAMMVVTAGALAADPGAGTDFSWTFTSGASGNGAFDFLREGETLVLNYTVKATDNSGAINDNDTQLVTITITGSNDAPDITGAATSASLSEINTTITANGTLNVVDADLADTVTMSVDTVAVDAASTFAGTNPLSNADLKAMMVVTAGALAADPGAGTDFSWTFTSGASGNGAFDFLREGETLVLNYTVKATDNSGAVNDNDTQLVTITITGSNDAPDITGAQISAGLGQTNTTITANGTLNVVDADLADTVMLTVDTVAVDAASTFAGTNPLSNADLKAMMAVTAGALAADPAGGTDFSWTFTSGASGDGAFDFLREGETLVLNYTIKATDDSGAVNDNDTQVVTITITGSNDAPDITGAQVSASLSETNTTVTASGTLNVVDANLADTVLLSVDTVAVDVSSTFAGANPLSNADLKAMMVVTAGALAADPGAGTDFSWTFTSGASGNGAFDFLREGETLVLNYTVKATDNSGAVNDNDTQLVTITITGSNDAPDITGAQISAGLGQTNTTITANGTLNVVDADLADTVTLTVDTVAVDAASTFAGTNPLSNADLKAMMAVTAGALAADPAGGTDFTWTFTSGASGDGAFDFLSQGETLVLNYTLKATDNSGALNDNDTQQVTITITGSNDAPDITGAQISAGLAETNTTLTATGTLNVVDANLADTVTLSVDTVAVDAASTFAGVNPLSNADLKAMMAVTNGALGADPSFGTDFTWTFTSGASGNGAFDFLREGETLVLNYTVKATDNSGAVNDNDTQLVTITITGSNDAPDITGAQISAGLSQTNTTITANGTLNVVDADLVDTVMLTVDTVAVDGTSTFAGANPLSNADLKAMMAVTAGALAADPAGGTDFTWTFTSGASGDGAFDFLREGETLVLNYTLKATDNSGALNDNDTQQVTITITGSNDAPDITGAQISAGLAETNTTLTATGTLNVVDANLADTVTLSVDTVAVDAASTFAGVNPLSNADLKAMMAVTNGALGADPSFGTDFTWTFTSGASGNGAFDFLREGETLVLNYTVKATDDSGAVNDNDTQLVTITITGSNDAPDITGAATSASLSEINTTITANGTLNVVDADLADTVTLSVDTVAVDAASTFAGTNPLSNADLKAMMAVTNGALGADPSFGTDFTWTFTSGASGNGAFDFLREGETLVLNYTVKATDNSGAVNDNDTQLVTITITGSNDAPDITGAQISAGLSQTNTTITANGTLNVVDADLVDTVMLTVDTVAVDGTSTFAGANPLSNADLKAMMAVTAGALAADPAGGTDFTWTFTSGASGDGAFDFLREGETLVLNYTLKATDNSGALNDNDTQQVTITITGSNDAPDITGAQISAGLAETNTTLTATGTLNVVDANLADTVTLSVDTVAVDAASTFAGVNPLSNADLKAMMAVTNGALGADPSFGTDFTWTFTSGASGNGAFDFLRQGETLVLNYTVKATDNSGAVNDNDTQLVTITITGSNDAPDITGAATSASLSEINTTITANGTLNVVDADLADTVTMSVDTVAVDAASTFAGTNPLSNADLKAMMAVTNGALGADPSFGTDFTWTFTSGASGNGAFDFLREGETLVLNYTVKATDNSGAVNDNDTQLVTITITGSNDAPDITGAQISAGLGQTNTTITANGTLNVVDADLADTVMLTVDTVAVDAASTFAGTNPLSNADLKAMMAVTAGALAADPAGGTDFSWTFTSGASGDGAFDFLSQGETLVLNYTLKATDNAGTPLSDTQLVTITITGSNDAPDITGAQVSASLSETNTTVTASGNLNVVDANLADTVLLSVDTVAVDAASTFAGANPLSNADLKAMMVVTAGALAADPGAGTDFSWTFTSGASGDGAFDFLRQGETLVLNYTLKATDNSGAVNDNDTQLVTVTITGSNDAPDITGAQISASLSQTNTTLAANGTLNVVDADLADTVMLTVDTVAVDGTSTFAGANPLSNADLKAMMAVTAGALAADPSAGTDFSWTFTSGASGDGAFNFLREGETLVLNYTLKATDNAGTPLSDTQVVRITITGSNDAPDITGAQVSASLSETNTTITASGTLNVVDANLADTVLLSVDSVAVDAASTFGGVNLLNNAALQAMMAVTAGALGADPSAGSDFTWTFTSGASGNSVFDFLREGETLVLNYTIKATDNSGAVNDSDTQVVTITITGSNDAPDITGAQISATLAETSSTITASGTLNVVDLDLADTVTMTVDTVAVDVSSTFGGANPLSNADLKAMMAVTAGALAADPSAGTDFTWTFTSGASGSGAFDFLRHGETLVLNYTLKATDNSGAVNDNDTQQVTITITGSNDALDITGVATSASLSETNTTLTANGTLNVVDADLIDSVTMTVATVAVDGAGTFAGTNPLSNADLKAMMAVTAGPLAADPGTGTDFSWTFTSGTSGNGAFDFLRQGETLVLNYTLKATDSSGAVNDNDTQLVTITITGSNDAPDITGAQVSANLSETNTTLTANGTLNVVDADLADTVVLTVDTVAVDGTSTFAGVNPLGNAALKAMMAVTGGVLTADPAGGTDFSWTFTSGASGDGAFDFLRQGETLVLNYTIKATDSSGAVNDNDTQLVTITINGGNDAPDITGVATSASLSETNTTLAASGTLNVVDADLIDTVTMTVDAVAVNGASTFAGTNPLSNAALKAMMTVTGGVLTADPAGGTDFSWTFTSGASGNGAFDFLRQGETLVLNYTVKATDNSGAVNDNDTQVVTITIAGGNDAPDITGAQVSASLSETNTTITAGGTLNVVDADLVDTVTLSVDSVAVGGASTFAGTNPLSNAALKAMMAVTAGALGADPAGGTDFGWTFMSGASGDSAFDFLRQGETLVLNYTLKATDNSGAINDNDTQLVTITITGSNDRPSLTITDTLGAMTEGNGAAALSDSGALSFADLDSNDLVTVSQSANNDIVWSGGALSAGQIAALVAGFSVDQDSWDYATSQNLDFLRAGETITFSYNVVATDNSGAGNATSLPQTVTIVVTGSNDRPTLTIADRLGEMTEGNGAATLSDSGALGFADLDTNDVVTVGQTSNNDIVWSGGTLSAGQIAALVAGFSVDQDSWDYTTSQNLDFLRLGETITFSYNVVATDNSGAGNAASIAQTVTIVITGSNDRPTLTIADRLGEMTEGNGAATLSDSGALGIADLDTNDVVTVSQTSNNDIVWSGGALSAGQIAALVAGFSVDQNSWDYATSQNLDFMRAGETITFSYNVVATDNSGAGNAASIAQTVTIVITGSNEAPVLATGTVTMAAQFEDAGLPTGPAGTRVSSLVSATGAGANVSDLDAGARLGIAITAANSDNGTWWYSLNDGGSWNALGSVSDASARLLAADPTARLYFQPNPDWNGTLSSALLLRAWDQTSGSAGGLANTSAAGGSSAFSSAAASASLTITSVNDAPRASDAQAGVETESSYVFSVADFRFADPRDTPSNQLAGVFIQGLPQAGRLSVAGVAVVAGQRVSAQDIAAGRLVYTPALNAADGSVASFAFQVQDSGGTANGGADLDPIARAMRVAVSVPFVPVIDTVVVATPAPAPVPAAAPEPTVERSTSTPVAEVEKELEESVPVDLMEQAPKVGSARDFFAANPGGQDQQVLVSTGSASTASPAIVALGESTVTELLEIMRLALLKGSAATDGGGAADGNSSSPVPGLVLGQVQAPQSEQEEQQSTRFGLSPQVAASVTGVLVSAGFVSWALRAGGLLTTLMISVPAWRNVDPLPILAPEDDKPKWSTDKEQDREEAALAGLWSAGTGHDADGDDR